MVATLLQVSIPNLQPSSQDASAFYLANVYQLLSNESRSQLPVTIPSSVTSLDPALFTVPASAVWVNSLWLLSLVISVTCALLATLLQQWARRYLRLTHPRCSPHKRARIRAFFAEGVENLHLPWTVEALPTLLHISVFLFFAGLGVYLFGVHKTIFSVVVAWVGLCVVVYAYVTALPILYKDSPYHAPLSSFIWFCIAGVRYTFSSPDIPPPRSNNPMPGGFVSRDPDDDRNQSLSLYSLSKTAEEYSSREPVEIDYRSLKWTFDSLDQDSDLEKFFEGVPDFCKSKAVENPVGGFIRPNNSKLSNTLTGLMDRTLSSSLVSESAKQRRITICTRAIDAANLFGPWWILPRVLLGEWQAFLRSVDFGLFLKDWARVDRPITTYYAQCVLAVIISGVPVRDDRWLQLVTHQSQVSKSVLRRYLNHGDSIFLANLNNIVGQTLRASTDIGEPYGDLIKSASSRTLESMCKLDARNSSPELQHHFCELWNRHVHAAQTNGAAPHVRNISLETLKTIRKIYISLHECTHHQPTPFAAIDDSDDALDDINSYPTCTIDSHRSTLSIGPPIAQGHVTAVGGGASQLSVSHPTAQPLPSPASMTSSTFMPFPTPVSPPAVNASQVFPGHQGAGQRAIHVGQPAPQAPSNGLGTPPGFPAPLSFPNPAPRVPNSQASP